MSVAALAAQSGVRTIGVAVTGDERSLTRSLAKASADIRGFEGTTTASAGRWSSAWKVAGAAVAVGLIAVAAGLTAAAVQAAGFEQRMRNVNSLLLVSDAELGNLSQSLLDISRDVKKDANDLAEGFYNIASSGFEGADGLMVVDAAARAAAAGMSTTATAAQVITASLNAYGLSAASATDVSDILFATVDKGVIEFDDLAGSLGNVIGMSSAAQVPLADVGTALATMTLAGIGAAEASTSLNRVIQSLIQPSDALANAYETLGYESGLQALQVKGLYGVMEDLRQVTQGNAEAYLQLFPEIRAARGAFALASDEGRTYARIQGEIGDATARAGATQTAFAEQMSAASARWEAFTNNLRVNAIEIGLRVLPAFTSLMDVISPLAEQVVPKLESVVRMLQPAFSSLYNTGVNVVEIFVALYEAFQPINQAINAVAFGTAAAGLQIVANVLESITGFMADNQALTVAVAALWLSRYLPSINAVVTGLKGFAVAANTARVSAISYVTEQIRYQQVLHQGAVFNGTAVGHLTRFRAAMAAATTTARGLGAALFSSGLAMAGLMIGISVLVYAAQTAADDVKESIAEIMADVDALDGISLQRASSELEQLRESLGEVEQVDLSPTMLSLIPPVAAYDSIKNIFDVWGEYTHNKEIEATNNAIAEVNEKIANTTVNLTALRDETGVSFDELHRLMVQQGWDLTDAFGTEKAEAMRERYIMYLRDMEKQTGLTTDQMQNDFGMTVDQMNALADAISDATSKTASAFASATDVIGSWKPNIGVAEEAEAMENLAEARKNLTEVERDSERTAKQLEAARDRVTKAEERLQDAQTMRAEGTLEAFYRNAIEMSSTFSRNLTAAVSAGLDPTVVAKLLQEGPAQAGPIVQQLVDDNSGALIQMMNDAEAALADISAQVVEQSRLTTIAVQSNTDELAKALPQALEISMLAWQGFNADQIARKLGLDQETVNKIAKDFGISLSTSLSSSMSSMPSWFNPYNPTYNPTYKGYAYGGIYPGYTPGRDIGMIGVSGGEAIMRPEFTRAVGHDWVHKMNKLALAGPDAVRQAMLPYLGGFAFGGIPEPQVITVPVTQRVESHAPIQIGTVYARDVSDIERQARARRRKKWGGRR